MLATEAARYPPAGNVMSSSVHPRGQVNGSATATHFAHAGANAASNRHGPFLSRFDQHSSDSRGTPSSNSSMHSVRDNNENIMNRKAPPDSSLFQICLNLRKRLAGVPGFHEHILEMEEEEADANDATDPVTTMWNCLRRGFPLLTLYNAFRPPVPLEVDPNIPENKVTKHAAFKFLQACMSNLNFPPSEMFLIVDLYGENTTGFVKVTRVVSRVLDLLEKRGVLRERKQSTSDTDSSYPLSETMRQKIVNELVETERDYINHLENLQQFKNELEQGGTLPGDVIHAIFLNLDGLLEFQRRFQVRLEQQYSSPEAVQQWGKVFWHYAEPFEVYIPFIANTDNCQKTVSREWEKLRNASISPELQGIVESQSVLLGFLSKPFQRLTKYPMLLDELKKKGGYDKERMEDLENGAEKARGILIKANEAIAKEARKQAVEELQQRVEDWKGHKIEHFGELLHYGTYTVLKGEGPKEVEREYKVFLFERILLCCKEINPNKPKNKMLGNSRPLVDKKGKPKLQLKGRIFMQNVTDVLTLTRQDRASFTVQIFWKGDPGVENFVIRFPDETTMVRWRDAVQEQKKRLSESRSSGPGTSSKTQFPWITEQPQPDNPYPPEDEQDDDESQSPSTGRSGFPVSRNPSESSLRNFSAQSSGLGSRMQHPRIPMPDHSNGNIVPPLSVNTNLPSGTNSPGEFAGLSYFSPSNDSPISTRVSSQASIYSFPRQPTPAGGWTHETNKHRTAPVMGRAPSREGYSRPSMPPMSNPPLHIQQPTSAPQNRGRSTSTPNIPNGNDPRAQRQPNGSNAPFSESIPVPPIPPGMRSNVNRSQTTSPVNGQLPIRNANQTIAYDARGQRLPPRHDNTVVRHVPSGYTGPNGHQSPPNNASTSISSAEDEEIPYPSQIKVKVWYDDANHYVTIVVGNNIKYRTLADRIDSKMVKITPQAISKATAKLVYEDAEGDLLSIQSDDDVQLAIEDWGTRHEKQLRERNGLVDDFELIWQEKPGT